MNRTFFALGGAAAAIVVAVLGLGLYFNGSGIGAPPSPTPSSRPSPEALPAEGAEVDPGWHFALEGGYRYTFQVPGAGWKVFGSTVLLKGDEQNDPPDFAGLGIWGNPTYANVQACWGGGIVSTGQTAVDMAAVFASLEGFSTSAVTDVTVGRYSGKRLQLTVPGAEFTDCSVEYNSFEGRYYQAPEQVDDIWILDLDEGDRALFYITYLPTTPVEWVEELGEMVESMAIEPVQPR
jgi:hypothetical protein